MLPCTPLVYSLGALCSFSSIYYFLSIKKKKNNQLKLNSTPLELAMGRFRMQMSILPHLFKLVLIPILKWDNVFF